MTDTVSRALEIAQGQVGQKENPLGSNWGHPVQDYLKEVGLNFPGSWCMAFMYWCFNNAAHQLGVENPLFKSAGVLAVWNNTPGAWKIKPDSISNVKPGDIMIMDLGGGLGHTGIVESVDILGQRIHTIEGNTNDTGSREGIEVAKKIRNFPGPKIKGFLRFA
jgi:hypothetical protein